MVRVLLLSLLMALGACAAAPPKPAMVPLGSSGDFGYSARDIGPERLEVSYRGDAVTVSVSNPREDSRTRAEAEKAYDLALWRAAQIAVERGMAGLKIENENRNNDIEVQRRSYYRPSPFYDPFWDPYDDPFYPRYRRPYYGGGWPYSYQQVRRATARAEITLTVTLYRSFDPNVVGMLNTAETVARLKAMRSGAVY